MDSDKYIGRLLDNRYEIQELIGVGGMAVVYKARCHRLNRPVAIKILKDDYSQDEDFRRRFHAESQAVAMLSHPNIVSVYDVSTTSAADYIVMELIDGISLKQYMEKKGVLNWKETLHFAMQIGKALEHAHSRGIVHRDIKPHNIMVLKNGSVKVTDFGIARVMSKGNTLTKEALGSVHYISPEQAKGGRVDDRSDIYSLGVVMYEMMTGRPPYDGESPVAVAIQHINGGAAMPSTLNPNIPGGLEQIIMKAMAHDPANRYNTATAMLYDMDEFRKDPAILFDYNLPALDDVTRIANRGTAVTDATVAVTTAEAVAAARTRQTGSVRNTGKTGMTPVSRNSVSRNTGNRGTGSAALRPGGAKSAEKSTEARRTAAQARRRREQEEQRNRVATLAIIGVSIVALIVISLFLIALFGGGSSDQTKYVFVPTYIGKDYDNLTETDGIVIRIGVMEHSDQYAKGCVIDQNPKPGDKVVRDTEVVLTVSLGEEPKEKTMVDLENINQTSATNYLHGQGFYALVREVYSDEIKEGNIVYTEPAKKEPLEDGQTIILYVSMGPEIQKGKMPNVVNQDVEKAKQILNSQGLEPEIVLEEESSELIAENRVIRCEPAVGEELITGQKVTLWISTGPVKAKMPNVVGEDINTALRLLEYAGFDKVVYDEYIYSDQPENQVLYQSVEKDQEIPISTQIVLKLSMGPTESSTSPPTTESTTAPSTGSSLPQVSQKTVTFTIKDVVMTEAYTMEIMNGDDLLFSLSMAAGETSVTKQVTGYGKQVYEIYIDGVYNNKIEVDFSA